MNSTPPTRQSAATARTQPRGNVSPLRPVQAADDVVTLGQLMGALWRGKWVIAAVTAVFIVGAFYYAYFSATPMFRSTAVLVLDTREEQVVELESVVGGLSGDTAVINTEVEVLRARGLLRKVVEDLDLITDPEFNPALQPPSVTDRMRDWVKAQVTAVTGLQFTPPGQALPDDIQVQRTVDATINQLLDAITVRTVPSSYVFQVTAETTDPLKSAAIADKLVELYIIEQIAVKFEATEQATTWLSDRVAELRVDLENAEQAVKDFNTSTDLINAQSLQALDVQLKELRDRISETEEQVARTAARLTALQGADTREEQAAIAADPQLDNFLRRFQTTGEDTMAQAFDTRFEQVLTRAELEADRAEAQLAALQSSSEELSERIAQQSRDLIQLQQLTREAEASRLLYESFLNRLKETSVQQGLQQADSRVLSDSVVPIRAASPKRTLIMVLSVVAGVFVGAGLVMLREARQNTFRTAEDLERITGQTVMGQIPQIRTRRRKDTAKYLIEKPTSAAAEAIRNLRTSVLLSNIDHPPKIIMLTSSVPSEGKTTQSIALSQNLAGLGGKVLLIEGDIRRRIFNQYFEIKEERGILAVLSGEATLEEVAVPNSEFGIDIVIGEKSNTNAADVFASEAFQHFLDRARELYDHIVIDTPPVLVVPDARVIGQSVDAILYVVDWDRTPRSQVMEGIRFFDSVNLKISGMVLNKINPSGMKRYGYGEKYGAYAAYGSKYYSN